MAQRDQETAGSTKPSPSNSIFAEFGEIGKKRAEAMTAAQTTWLEGLRGVNQHWIGRAQSEAELASELITKLTAARSVPETVTVYQEWASRRMQLAMEDSQRLFSDSLKLMETSARLFTNSSTGHRD
jgi:hypothetical protein